MQKIGLINIETVQNPTWWEDKNSESIRKLSPSSDFRERVRWWHHWSLGSGTIWLESKSIRYICKEKVLGRKNKGRREVGREEGGERGRKNTLFLPIAREQRSEEAQQIQPFHGPSLSLGYPNYKSDIDIFCFIVFCGTCCNVGKYYQFQHNTQDSSPSAWVYTRSRILRFPFWKGPSIGLTVEVELSSSTRTVTENIVSRVPPGRRRPKGGEHNSGAQNKLEMSVKPRCPGSKNHQWWKWVSCISGGKILS